MGQNAPIRFPHALIWRASRYWMNFVKYMEQEYLKNSFACCWRKRRLSLSTWMTDEKALFSLAVDSIELLS
jgi:hypothetical protein